MNCVDVSDVCLCARFGHTCVHMILDVSGHFRMVHVSDINVSTRFWMFFGRFHTFSDGARFWMFLDVSGLEGRFRRFGSVGRSRRMGQLWVIIDWWRPCN